MSLPKRDGVHGRYYLIHKPDTDPEVLVEADLCIQDVLSGAARENHAAYPTVVRNHNGTPFLPNQLLERHLSRLPPVSYTHLDVYKRQAYIRVQRFCPCYVGGLPARSPTRHIAGGHNSL